jgi:hypothetical protein
VCVCVCVSVRETQGERIREWQRERERERELESLCLSENNKILNGIGTLRFSADAENKKEKQNRSKYFTVGGKWEVF